MFAGAAVVLALVATGCRDTATPSASSAGTTTTTTTTTPAPSGPLVVAAGDIACPPTRAPSAAECQQDATATLVESLHPDAVLALGDIQYERGEYVNFRDVYNKSWGRFRSITHPAPGNHEWALPNAIGYRTYFPEAIGPGARTYYSFDIGSWHVVALDSNCRSVGGCQAGSPQEQWLRADLAAHRTECMLAFWHHPRWSSGIHGSDPGYDAFWQALADAGADVVLSGHDHDYERFAPDRGVRQFVVGTGGRSLYPVLGREARTQVHDATSFGVLALHLNEGSYSWRFAPVPGSSFTDTGSARC